MKVQTTPLSAGRLNNFRTVWPGNLLVLNLNTALSGAVFLSED